MALNDRKIGPAHLERKIWTGPNDFGAHGNLSFENSTIWDQKKWNYSIWNKRFSVTNETLFWAFRLVDGVVKFELHFPFERQQPIGSLQSRKKNTYVKSRFICNRESFGADTVQINFDPFQKRSCPCRNAKVFLSRS